MTSNATRVMALAVAVCATVLAGCGGDPVGTAPATLSDPAGLTSDVQSFDTPLQAAVFQSFSTLGAGSPLSARTVSFLASMTPTRVAPATREAAVRKQAFAVKSLRPSFASEPTGAGSLIPESYWGKVYVWSTSTQEYVEGAATGGPATGVRFTLYAINPVTNQPAEPLNPIGYADLTDQSTDAQYKLGVRVGDATTIYADYMVSATATASSFAATAAGFITDGTRRLDFTNSASASSTHISIDFDLTLNQPHVAAHLHADLVAGDPTTVLTLNFGVTRGSETVVLSGTLGITSSQSGASASANLVIAVNDRQFATITGTVHSGSATGYTVDGPDRALTQSERAAVEQLMASPALLAAAVEPVFAPAEDLVGSSYSLGF